MKIIIVVALFLAGCGGRISDVALVEAEKICHSHRGVWLMEGQHNNIKVAEGRCGDGMYFLKDMK